MEIILKQDIANLGQKDEIIKVRDGYAMNFLIPKGMATMATPSARKQLTELQKQRAHKEARVRMEAVALAEQLNGKELTIGAKTSTTGKIFGSVNTIQIAEALSKKGFEIDRKKIMIKEDHIKEVGKYSATIKLYKDIIVEIPFEVVSE